MIFYALMTSSNQNDTDLPNAQNVDTQIQVITQKSMILMLDEQF